LSFFQKHSISDIIACRPAFSACCGHGKSVSDFFLNDGRVARKEFLAIRCKEFDGGTTNGSSLAANPSAEAASARRVNVSNHHYQRVAIMDLSQLQGEPPMLQRKSRTKPKVRLGVEMLEGRELMSASLLQAPTSFVYTETENTNPGQNAVIAYAQNGNQLTQIGSSGSWTMSPVGRLEIAQGNRHEQLAALRLVATSAQQTVAQRHQLEFAHGTFHSQQQAMPSKSWRSVAGCGMVGYLGRQY
jgi:hypothetical protein